jgi:hypothetical protein
MAVAVVVREAPRIAAIEPVHELAASAGGTGVFAIALVVGATAIAWVARVSGRPR